jgi:pimeloyl-ACP methyl ester carboxylesterase
VNVTWLGQRFAKHGFNVLLFDYRGYGASDGVAGDEAGLYADGDPDRTIPTSEARILFASANEPKKLLLVPGAGHVPFGSAGEQYFNQVEQFMREVLTARQ